MVRNALYRGSCTLVIVKIEAYVFRNVEVDGKIGICKRHSSLGMFNEKYGCLSASRTVIRCAGSNVSSCETRSRKCRLMLSVGGTTSWRGRVARTSFLLCLDALALGQSSLPPSLKNSGLDRAPARPNRSGILPMTISIIARCSRLS